MSGFFEELEPSVLRRAPPGNIAAPLDLLYPQVMFYSHMPSVLLRAEAYARMGNQTSAVTELTKIIDNPGIVQLSATAPVAKLQLARA